MTHGMEDVVGQKCPARFAHSLRKMGNRSVGAIDQVNICHNGRGIGNEGRLFYS